MDGVSIDFTAEARYGNFCASIPRAQREEVESQNNKQKQVTSLV
jgi:hypothetical protein